MKRQRNKCILLSERSQPGNYIPYDSDNMTFWEGKAVESLKRISDCKGEVLNRLSTEDF